MSSPTASADPDSRNAIQGRMAWLNSRIALARAPLVLAIGLGAAGGAVLLAQAWILAGLLDAVISGGEAVSDRLGDVVSLLALYLVRVGLSHGAALAGFEASARVRISVRRAVTHKLARLGPSYMKSRSSGEVASVAMEQIEALDGFFGKYLPAAALAWVVPATILAVVAGLDWGAAIILAIAGPLVPALMGVIGMGTAAAARKQMATLARMSGYFLDRLQGLATLRLFGQAENELVRSREIADEFRVRTMRILRVAFLTSTALELLASGTIVLLAAHVALAMSGQPLIPISGTLTLPVALFVLLLAPDFFQPFRQLTTHYHDRASALGAAEALVAILDQPDPPAGPGTTIDTDRPVAVSLRNVRLDYGAKSDGGRVALDGVDIDVAPGEKVALVGQSGAGKSSVIELLLGFEQPSSGDIQIDGKPADGHAIREIAAWAGQASRIFHGTIASNIKIGAPDATDQDVRAAAEAARVTDFTDPLPDGLNTAVGERGHGLSGGEARRVALARAFLRDRPLLLLDEPTANLDRENEALVVDAIERLSQNRTVLIATHSPAVIERCDRSIRLEAGRVEAEKVEVGNG